MRDQKLFLDGAWVDGVDTFEVHDPFDQTQVGTVAVASPEQAAEAVDAAKAAMRAGWPASARADLLLETSRLVAERAEDFAEQIRAEAGKPIAAARVEVSRAVTTLRVAGEEARRLPSETVQFDEINGVVPFGFTVPAAVRRGRGDHPVQLPAEPGAAQGGAGAGGRLRGGAQAVGADAADRRAAGRDAGRGGAPVRLATTWSPASRPRSCRPGTTIPTSR